MKNQPNIGLRMELGKPSCLNEAVVLPLDHCSDVNIAIV